MIDQGLDETITAAEICETQEYVRKHVDKTPLLPLNVFYPDKKVYLKLENLSPIGSFKLRGGVNCLRHLSDDDVADGVCTASTGNFAQGLLWACNERGIPCTILLPESTAHTKVEAIERLGGSIIKMSYSDWWKVLTHERSSCTKEKFIHPVCNRNIVLGNSVIGKEIYDDLPDVDTVLVPYGGGALATGIGSMFKAFKPTAKVIVCEVETCTPVTAAFKAGKPVDVETKPSLVDINSVSVMPEFYNVVRRVVDDTVVVSVDSVASTIKLLAERNRVIAEGAGAVTVSAAIQGLAGTGNIVCVVSGGNIDTEQLVAILNGETLRRQY